MEYYLVAIVFVVLGVPGIIIAINLQKFLLEAIKVLVHNQELIHNQLKQFEEEYSDPEEVLQKEHEKEIYEQYSREYSEACVRNMDEIYTTYRPHLVHIHNTLTEHFVISPMFLGDEKVQDILMKLPEETNILKNVGRIIIDTSCAHQIGISRIISYLKERYRLSEVLTIPLFIVCNMGIRKRNSEINTTPLGHEWLHRISSSDLILSISHENYNSNYSLSNILHQEYTKRLKAGVVTHKTFRELHVIMRSLEEFNAIQQRKAQSEDKDLPENKYVDTIITTIQTYYHTFKNSK